MTELHGGHLVAKVLKAEGIEYLFALCGGHIDAIFQGCVDEGIGVVDTRHEQSAVFAAEAYAWLTGKPGAAAVTAGAGVTNAVTGLWTAKVKGSPIVVFWRKVPNLEVRSGNLAGSGVSAPGAHRQQMGALRTRDEAHPRICELGFPAGDGRPARPRLSRAPV